jgi:hypothetical protein
MAPVEGRGYGSHDEAAEEGRRARALIWFISHRIVYSRGPNESETIEVMAWDRGADAPGPGRYALYTQENREQESEPEWTMDVEGRVWFRGAPLPDSATAVVEEVPE